MPGIDPLSGAEGEKIAARYLEKKGYRVLERNYRTCGAEIDLVVLKGDLLCFIEVKTRKSDHFGMPAEYVDYPKTRKIIRAAKVFSGKRKYAGCLVRFDIVALVYKAGQVEIDHIEAAFEE